ncbi:DUF4153 domain-containing protein [Maritimibacter sp. 55A14]|uniref:DUF4153 domain-containing protein n=1 Tax=Maritimibacter sp. 55A14 TaxID=2174844 RepID=UPI000D60FEDE|nr:DUF4153 domain-containing protein [Maritimibacter sp. 55A14]PWE29277.1 DUF4153 domain-containing protein [Maritimibacter sp. 55A14]
MATDRELAGGRLVLGLFGAVAGVCLWYLYDAFRDAPEPQRLLLFLIAAAAGFFGGTLVATGPVSFPRAAALSAPLALAGAGLLTWSSLRHDGVEAYLETGHPVAAWLAIWFMALPFLIAGAMARGGWRDYSALFEQSWSIVVRGATAWIFTGVFWLVYTLSDTLLGLVGITLLADLTDHGWFVMGLSGLVLGLGLAVLSELSSVLTPSLVLRMLRLLLPVVTAVVAVFLVMVPIRGLDDVFGSLSAAGTLLAMAVGAITLVTSALDEDDFCATDSPIMRATAQIMSLLLPVLAALAGWAVWVRVAQYGWTPDRLMAALAALAVMLYALLYAVSVALRGGWMARIRAGNTWMAMGLMGLSVLWLTPVLNPERISAQSQVARFESGRVSAEALDLWTLGREFGRPGRAALEELRAMTGHPEHAALLVRLAKLENAESRVAFEGRGPYGRPNGDAERNLAARLAGQLRVHPADAELPEGLLDNQPMHFLRRLRSGCDQTLADGGAGCVVALVDLADQWPGPEAMIFLAEPGGQGTRVTMLRRGEAGYQEASQPTQLGGDLLRLAPSDALGAVAAGRFSIGQPSLRALSVEGVELVPRP